MGTTPSDSRAEDSEATEATADDGIAVEDQREHLRFDKMFVVRLESLLFGEIYCVARNVSAGGIFLELPDPLPLGASVRVCFPVPDGSGDVVATGEVKNHYFINYTQGGSNRAVAG
ncbi:MAG TPA: PilZ domain-containing protein, partial [Polyangia bacterium]